MNRKLYFAFGSNMDRGQMAVRCPSATEFGAAAAYGWRLEFRGWSSGRQGAVATVIPRQRAVVHGLLWLVSEAEMQRLDLYEGAPWYYGRHQVEVSTASGRPTWATTYILNPEHALPGCKPNPDYAMIIAQAYRDLGLDWKPLREALQRSARSGEVGNVSDDTFELFVYGTLRRGQGNSALLQGCEYLGQVRTTPDFNLFQTGSLPVMTTAARNRGTGVVGELYRVPSALLPRLDALEGHPDFYRRSSIMLQDGRRATAYLIAQLPARNVCRIPNGDWLSWSQGGGRLGGDWL